MEPYIRHLKLTIQSLTLSEEGKILEIDSQKYDATGIKAETTTVEKRTVFPITILSDGTNNTLRVDCSLQSSCMGQPMPSTIRIFNLSAGTRDALHRARTRINIEAGYGLDSVDWAAVYSGDIIAGYSERQGNNIVTTLRTLAAGRARKTAVMSASFSAGTPVVFVIRQLAKQFDGIVLDETTLNQLEGSLGRKGWAEVGYVEDMLDNMADLYGFSWHVENDILYCIPDKKDIEYELEISPETGLISASPLLSGPIQMPIGLKIKTVWIPGLVVGKTITVKSSVNKNYNGRYKVHLQTTNLSTHSNEWTVSIDSYNSMGRKLFSQQSSAGSMSSE